MKIINCIREGVVFNDIQTIELQPEEEFQIELKDNVTTGYTWVYKIESKNSTEEIIKEHNLSDNKIDKTKIIFGSPSILKLTFRSKKSDILYFYHVRPWLNQKLEDLKPNFIINIIIKNNK